MEKLVIDKRRDYIIVEKYDGNKVIKGSKFFCGCCGNVLGESKKQLKFPFSVSDFNKSLKNKTFNSTVLGLYHKTCGHTMFGFKKGYDFIPLSIYLENVIQN